MADKRISQLPQGNITSESIFPIVSSNVTSQVTFNTIVNALEPYFSGETEVFISGMTFNTSNYDLTLSRNDGVNFTQNLGILATDMTITGGTYSNGTATFTNNSGGTFEVTGFLTGTSGTIGTNTFVSGGTYSNGTATFTNNSGGTFEVTGFNNYSPRLHSTDDKLKFVMYWPRLSPNMDWWKELDENKFTWDDISDDLDKIKEELGVNAIRIFTYYDNQWRQTGTLGWTDGVGNHNPIRLVQLQDFIRLAKSKNLDVVITMYQLLPALDLNDNWDFLEDDIDYFLSFHSWVLNGIKDFSNIVVYNLINEPDGYGVFSSPSLGSRVLIFLDKLKKLGKTISPKLKCIINSTTHDNSYRRFPNTPADASSIYDITDVLAHNSFRWADTGDWAGTNFQTQIEYLNTKNILNKPIGMMECGFPANYAQQSVSGYPLIDESGIEIGGVATITEESIVPQGNIFNRPFGISTGLSHTEENQNKSIGEAIAICEKYDLDCLGAWSAFDHANSGETYVYRDPFGLIDKNGNVLPAGKTFKYGLTEKYSHDLNHKLSLSSGSVGGDARINGLGGYNSIDTSKNTPGGVYLGINGSYWDSGDLAVSFPTKILLNFNIRTVYTHQEPIIISIITEGKQLDFRYKVYGVNSWQRLNATSSDIDRGFASNSPILSDGNHTFEIDMSTINLSPNIIVDGVLLDYSSDGIEPFDLWMLADGFKIIVRNNSDSPIDINEIFAKGNYEGESIPMNRYYANPIIRQEITPRKLKL